MSYLNDKHKDAYASLLEQLKKSTSSLAADISINEKGEFPLLMLESDLEIAGFGILQVNAAGEYKSSYETFKHAYSFNRKKWARYNVSFVICKPDDLLGENDFFNRIETDIYFCRKYVISTGERLPHEIERLPFVPLDRGSIALPRRPVSAQSLLQNLGADADLAQSIVVPGQKKGLTIAEECLLGKSFESVTHLDDASIYQKGVTEAKPFSRIKSITINDFRAYKGRHVFNLDADLVILYGPNGLGKTSFFDSIDYASTGGCGRFREIGGDDSFRKAAHHLDADPKDTFVELEVESDAGTKKFNRNLTNPNKVSVNGTLKDRTSALFELTGLLDGEFEKRVETITNLFRATHLFGQDFQTLTEGFGKTSELSLDIVSRMLAFQDYARSDQKIAEVLSAFQQEKKRLEDNQKVIKERIEELRLTLNKYNAAMVPLDTPSSLSNWLDELLRLENGGIELPKKNESESAKEYIRSIRSVLEAHIVKESAFLSGITKVLGEYEDLTKALTQIEALHSKLLEVGKELVEKQTALDVTKKAMLDIDALLGSFKATEIAERKFLENLIWLKQAMAQITSIRELLQESILNRASKETDLLSIEEALVSHESELAHKKEELFQSENSLKQLLATTEETNRIRSLVEKQEISNSEALGYKLAILRIEGDEQKLSVEIEGYRSKIQILNDKKASLTKERDELLKKESELNSLIEKLKFHVHDSNCPACGFDHGTKDKVLELLSRQSTSQSIDLSSKTEALYSINVEAESVSISISNAEVSLKQIILEKESLTKRIHDQKNAQELLDNDLMKIGITGSDSKGLLSSLDAFLSQKRNLIVEIQSKIADINVEVTDRIKNSVSIYAKKDNLKKEVLELSAKVVAIEKDIQDRLSEAAKRGLAIDKIAPTIEAKIVETEVKLAEVRVLIGSHESKANELRLDELVLKEKISVVGNQKDVLNKDKDGAGKVVSLFAENLRKLSIPIDATHDELLSSKRESEIRSSEQHSMLAKISTAETAIDSSERSAEVARITADLSKNESEMTVLTEKELSTKEWASTFTKIRGFLASVRDSSISEYTENYGPLASTIQSRLRSVYGFGEISLSAVEGKITVTVKRKEDEFRPIDYFSESQKQILVLSIFFASAITQNWSSFSPIFLDDPVTHFDDLNAYAFLDLIAGMLHSEKGRRQFVISTCEEKLFQLMRQKFYAYGKRVIIYEFLGIGQDGPLYRQIENGDVLEVLH